LDFVSSHDYISGRSEIVGRDFSSVNRLSIKFQFHSNDSLRLWKMSRPTCIFLTIGCIDRHLANETALINFISSEMRQKQRPASFIHSWLRFI